jgi:hypothetical protein
MNEFDVSRDEVIFGNSILPTTVAAVRVDGLDLRALVIEAQLHALAERFHAGDSEEESLDEWLDPTGWVAFLALDDVAPPSGHWLGEPLPRLTEGGRAAVLTCTCGFFGCGGVAATITIGPEIVTWSHLADVGSGAELPLPAYEFDRTGYEAALSRLAQSESGSE